MTGIVQDLQACVTITFLLPSNNQVTLEFIVDTGFAGALTLSPNTIHRLGLPFELELDSILADGSSVLSPVYRGKIIWQENELEIAVLALGDRP
jgi:clan AA aspartic protease